MGRRKLAQEALAAKHCDAEIALLKRVYPMCVVAECASGRCEGVHPCQACRVPKFRDSFMKMNGLRMDVCRLCITESEKTGKRIVVPTEFVMPKYVYSVIKGRIVFIQDMIWERATAEKIPDDHIVMHHDGDVLNNTTQNLVLAFVDTSKS